MSGAGNANQPRILEWREHRKGSKLGTVSVLFPSGLVLNEVTIHREGERCWAAPPARAKLIEGTTDLAKDREGRQIWEPIVTFHDVEVRRRWSDQVVAAFRMAFPEAFGLEEGEP